MSVNNDKENETQIVSKLNISDLVTINHEDCYPDGPVEILKLIIL
jgi:hypothetical protein